MTKAETTNGRIIVFHAGKAGEGKSLLAQNLAAMLGRYGKFRVLLFDLDPQARQEHNIRWDLAVGPTLAELCGNLARFDENTIRGYFPKSRSGVEVAVLAESEPGVMGVAGHQILRALELFRKAYDFVVVDGLAGWDSLALSVLDSGDRILLVCSPDIVGLKQEREHILNYQELKFPAAKIGLILNRAGMPGALRPEDLEKALPGHKVLAAIPFDLRAAETLNQQRELIAMFPNSSFAKAVKELARRLEEIEPGAAHPSQVPDREMVIKPSGAKSDYGRIKERIHGLVLENTELKDMASEITAAPAGQVLLREKVEAVIASLMVLEAPELTCREAREKLVQEMVDEVLGLGPLENLIRDPEVTEIMVNQRDQIFIEKAGRLVLSGRHFLNDKQLMTVIERIVAPLGRRIDESQPYVDARLADGSRVNAIIPPLALKGPALTIRKFSRQRLLTDDLIKFGSLNRELAEFLGACVRGRKNIVIAGGTGSGKTTLLNIAAAYIPESERIITVEDAAELNLPQPHVVVLETRPANIEGQGAITIRDLVRNCLRMRPDRIVVGECRGGETLDMLQAMNTGHDGSLTTVHANSPRDTIARLETMVLMSGMDLPVRAIREQIAGAVDLIVQQSRLQDGSRKVTRVSEVAGMEDGKIVLKDIFIYKQTGLNQAGQVQGDFKAAGYMPGFLKELAARGIEVRPDIFKRK